MNAFHTLWLVHIYKERNRAADNKSILMAAQKERECFLYMFFIVLLCCRKP